MIFKHVKRGQSSAGGASAMVAIIALLIVLYILFIPEEKRQEILDGTYTSTYGQNNNNVLISKSNVTYINENIGKISHLSETSTEFQIPSFSIYTQSDAKILSEFQTLEVSSSLFENRAKTITLSLDSIDTLNNILLSFSLKESSGSIKISLNNVLLYDGEIKTVNVAPIKIDKKLLSGESKLSFEVSSPGMLFWKTNKYVFENLKLTADKTDISKKSSAQTIFVKSEIIENIQSTRIQFTPDCSTAKDKLNILINGNFIYSAVPDCGSLFRTEFDPSILVSGPNTVSFSTDGSTYLIDRLKIMVNLKSPENYVRYFEINDTEYLDVRNDNRRMNLTFKFLNDRDRKIGDVLINNIPLRIDTYNLTYTRNLKDFIKSGTNSIELVPNTTMEIVNFKVESYRK